MTPRDIRRWCLILIGLIVLLWAFAIVGMGRAGGPSSREVEREACRRMAAAARTLPDTLAVARFAECRFILFRPATYPLSESSPD